MKDLFRSEWRRFRRLAFLVALIHGVALLLISRVADVPQLAYDDQGMMLIVYMLLGLVLAVVQVGSYRQTSRWLWLIHRPLPPSRIFAALAMSALALLSVAILAPLLVFLSASHAFTAQVVDTRHYVTLLLAMAYVMMAWLAGAHASTSRHKVAVAVLLAPLMLALHLASVWWLLLPVSVCVAWLWFVALHSFRANRDAPIARHRVLVLTALPLQLAFFLMAFHLSKGGLELVDLLGRRPGKTVMAGDKDFDVDAFVRTMTQKGIADGLKDSSDPRAATWREQLPLVKVASLTPDIARFPVRHQLGNVAQPWWDQTRDIKWTFSHDRMLFRGRELRTGKERGWWGTAGIGGKQRFADVPAFGMTRTKLYAVDDESQRQYELLQLPAGEWFTARAVNALDHVLVQTNRRLLAYRPPRDAMTFAPLELDWQIPLVSGAPAPLSIDIAEMLDGWLVSIFYADAREFDGFDFLTDPFQKVVYVDADGHSAVVGRQLHMNDHHVSFVGAATVPVASWWVSPPLYAIAHLPDLLNTGSTHPPRFELLPRRPLLYALALALMLLSLGAAYVWLRGTPVNASRRRLWLVSCALLGMPAFLSLICLEPRRTPCL